MWYVNFLIFNFFYYWVIESNKKYTIIYKIDEHTTEEESSHDRIETPIPLNKIIILYLLLLLLDTLFWLRGEDANNVMLGSYKITYDSL